MKRVNERIKGWILTSNLNILSENREQYGEIQFGDNGLKKFPKDSFFHKASGEMSYLDGYVLNKQELVGKYQISWNEILYKVFENKSLLKDFRGGFDGFVVSQNKIFVFNDQLGNKAVYYYKSEKCFAVSSRWNEVMDVLKNNGCRQTFNEKAAQYMLTYGYMLDNSTFTKEIYRLLPGQYLEYDRVTGDMNVCQYFLLNNTAIENISEKDAVDRIDYYFRQAVKREFEKDVEYGYQHLTDLSGGLDSRMVTWVAHEMGYEDQVNITYCRSRYLDFRIAQEIAKDLRHEFLFRSLDDFKWFWDVDEIMQVNNGAALYTGISGGYRFLEQINTDLFGIEHTGMVGDAILSTFFHDEAQNFSAPQAGLLRYSDRLDYDVSEEVLKRYDNMELFSLYTRGLLGAQTSYFIRQNQVETSSPFLDIDFITNVFSLPFSYRKKHNIYLKWINGKYPDAANYGWEKWGGIRPTKKQEWKKYLKYVSNITAAKMRRLLGRDVDYNMTSIDLFMSENKAAQCFIEKYYQENIQHEAISGKLRKDMEELFAAGTATEKAQVISVLSMVKNYWGE